MKQHILLYITAILFSGTITAQHEPGMKELIERNFQQAAEQYKMLEQHTPADKMPRTFNGEQLQTSGTDWWTSGFFPASLWLIYEATGDTAIKSAAERRLGILESQKRYTGNHDIGFMIFTSFGNAYRITGNPAYKDVIDTAAFWQITRYRPAIQSIQSWNKSDRYACPVIIDNMMNLEQLCWDADHGGNPEYRRIAITHANTTMKNHYRKDHSSWHVVDYDLHTGGIIRKLTAQGLADSSAWARGQSWGLYGFTMMYRYTKDKKYLAQAQAIARFLLHHPHMPADGVPLWDYDAPDTPATLRDASAGAILASALLELAQYSPQQKQEYVHFAEKILRTLSAPHYRAESGTNGGFLLKHSVGSLPGNSEVDVPLTYADYYFLEALKRFKDWYL